MKKYIVTFTIGSDEDEILKSFPIEAENGDIAGEMLYENVWELEGRRANIISYEEIKN